MARIALATALAALWANAHAGFPLGLLADRRRARGASSFAAPLRAPEQRRADRARARASLPRLRSPALATLANPAGVGAHLAYFTAGPRRPRSSASWTSGRARTCSRCPRRRGRPPRSRGRSCGRLLIGVALALYARRAARARRAPGLDPALAGVSLLALALALAAVRFLWLGIFPLLLFASAWRPARAQPASGVAVAARGACSRPPSSSSATGPRSRAACRHRGGYARPYPVEKYYAHAIWLLADSGVRGNLYNDYFLGGFAGYWLAPGVRSIVNGTLNFPTEIARRARARSRSGAAPRPGEDFTALLDRLGIDLFLGIRLPEAGLPGDAGVGSRRPPISRTRPAGSRSSATSRARSTCARTSATATISIASRATTREQRVPFDRERGFEIDAVIRDAPELGDRHGVVPRGFVASARTRGDESARADVRARATASPRSTRRSAATSAPRRSTGACSSRTPEAVRVRRRLVWSLLRLGRDDEARRDRRGRARGAARGRFALALDRPRGARSFRPGTGNAPPQARGAARLHALRGSVAHRGHRPACHTTVSSLIRNIAFNRKSRYGADDLTKR